jgi:hypothetical protein
MNEVEIYNLLFSPYNAVFFPYGTTADIWALSSSVLKFLNPIYN